MDVMKMPALLSRTADTLPGVIGIARIDKNTSRLLERVARGTSSYSTSRTSTG